MFTLLDEHPSKHQSSALAGFGAYGAHPVETNPRTLTRREWWLWLSAVAVTLLSALGFLLSSLPFLFLKSDHFYEMRSEQAVWGILSLLLLFNIWMVYRQWSFRRVRKQEIGRSAVPAAKAEVYEPSGVEPVTGLSTGASIEQRLGKEIARARRQNTPLSLATFHLDDFAQLNQRYGKAACDQALKEFARRLEKASRGSDFAARWGSDFLLLLPECSIREVKLIFDRLGSMEMNVAGQKITLECSTGWVDYQTGDLPADMLKRAEEMLQLYQKAGAVTRT
jgi:diguanylate cyclase (GGDEF)-like protein